MTTLVALSTGVSLEIKLSSPPTTASNAEHKSLAILLHPWSRLGGRYSDPVLLSLTTPLHAKGYHVIRYNSRGVGRSTGWASLTGSSEANDLAALVEWALSEVGNVRKVVVLGYSYGALIASLQPILEGIETAHILLSYPIAVRGWLTLFNHKKYEAALRGLLGNPKGNLLVVYGDGDDFTAVETYRRWKDAFSRDCKLEVVEVAGATHFWRDSDGVELVGIVEKWLA
ncbi:alpha/beta-hydrolase [Roridomyces roridus]|uniref:Alpha/beta-hydrolase n=1 Tax=Roridomyces roridus TaxID=1738132 RepID=A0AAD7CJ46_9AGAR|nr:alpha/beta-hydrolase [Roridomyces roridus]